MAPTLNIAALARRTGLPADTIRKWEQRYGVLNPARTDGGQRRYTETDVARVEWLKARLGEGYRIGEAAALLGHAGVPVATSAGLRGAFVSAAEASDAAALTAIVEQALAVDPVERCFSQILGPALVEVGERWAAGKLTVAQEHLASSTVRSALQRLLADGRSAVRGVAVAACAPGERHEIGLQMVSVLLRADGWQVAYLGADTPLADALALAAAISANALCLSAGSKESATALRREVKAARLPRSLRVVVGGRSSGGPEASAAVRDLRSVAA